MDADGLEVEQLEGEGPPLVFVHGWLGSKDFWKLITPFLDDNPKIFYNQRCHGNSRCSEFGIDDLADDLHKVIERLELEEPVIIGHSMGGMTALKYAVEYDNYSGLCLLGTSASTPEPENKSVRYFLEKFDELDRAEWAEQITENYAGQVEDPEIRKMTRRELEAADKNPIIYGLQAMIDYDVRDELDRVDGPSVVVAAEKDGAITMAKSRELAELLDCELKTVDTSHQMLPERPEMIAKIVSDFINNEEL